MTFDVGSVNKITREKVLLWKSFLYTRNVIFLRTNRNTEVSYTYVVFVANSINNNFFYVFFVLRDNQTRKRVEISKIYTGTFL